MLANPSSFTVASVNSGVRMSRLVCKYITMSDCETMCSIALSEFMTAKRCGSARKRTSPGFSLGEIYRHRSKHSARDCVAVALFHITVPSHFVLACFSGRLSISSPIVAIRPMRPRTSSSRAFNSALSHASISVVTRSPFDRKHSASYAPTSRLAPDLYRTNGIEETRNRFILLNAS